MGMLSRLRERGEAFVAKRLQGKAVSFSGRIPLRRKPLFEFTLEALAEPEADGERVRLRARSTVYLPGQAVRSWFEMRASTAALDDAATALVPEKLERLGIKPVPGKPVQTWAGGLGGPRAGFATLTLMQIDKDDLPPALQQALGPKPLHIAATMASVIEEDR
jgi:hypothetical protein